MLMSQLSLAVRRRWASSAFNYPVTCHETIEGPLPIGNRDSPHSRGLKLAIDPSA
jgi:hypothetical protein